MTPKYAIPAQSSLLNVSLINLTAYWIHFRKPETQCFQNCSLNYWAELNPTFHDTCQFSSPRASVIWLQDMGREAGPAFEDTHKGHVVTKLSSEDLSSGPPPSSLALLPWTTLPLSESEAATDAEFQLYNLRWGQSPFPKAASFHRPREDESMAWSAQTNREPWKQTGKGRRSRRAGQKNSSSKWFHFANSIEKTDGFSRRAGEQIMKSAFPKQLGLKSFILKIHTGWKTQTLWLCEVF